MNQYQDVPASRSLEQQSFARASAGTRFNDVRSQGSWDMTPNERRNEFGTSGSSFDMRQELQTITRDDQPSLLGYTASRIVMMPTASQQMQDKMMSDISVACHMDFLESMTETLVPNDLWTGLHEFFTSDQSISKEFILYKLGMWIFM